MRAAARPVDLVLSVALLRELLEQTSTPTLVRLVRPLAVVVRERPGRYTAAELALMTDLARVKLNDPSPPPLPLSAAGALVVALRRESPHLHDVEVEHLAGVLVREISASRAAART